MKPLALVLLLASSALAQSGPALQTPRYDVPPRRYALSAAALNTDVQRFQGEVLLLTRTLSPALERTLRERLAARRIHLLIFLSQPGDAAAVIGARRLVALGARAYRIRVDFGRGRLLYGPNIAVGGPVDGHGDGQMFVSSPVAQAMRAQLASQLLAVSTPL